MPNVSRVILRLLVVVMLATSLWAIEGSVASTGQTERLMRVTVVKPLEQINKVAPAEIRCGMAHININNELEFHCSLRNNTQSNVSAVSVTYAIVVETDGVESRDEYNSVAVSLVGAHFNGADEGTLPNGEISVGPPGPVSYNHSVIKAVEIGIDFIELDGGTVIGGSNRGSQVVKDVRGGAIKYKNWVSKKYLESAKSLNSLGPVLEDGAFPTGEAAPENDNQKLGANMLRRLLKRARDAGDYRRVETLLTPEL